MCASSRFTSLIPHLFLQALRFTGIPHGMPGATAIPGGPWGFPQPECFWEHWECSSLSFEVPDHLPTPAWLWARAEIFGMRDIYHLPMGSCPWLLPPAPWHQAWHTWEAPCHQGWRERVPVPGHGAHPALLPPHTSLSLSSLQLRVCYGIPGSQSAAALESEIHHGHFSVTSCSQRFRSGSCNPSLGRCWDLSFGIRPCLC